MIRFLVPAIALLSLYGPSQQSNKGRPERLHVSSVQRKQESDENGSTIHNRVITESKTIRYVLTCDDLFPRQKSPILCTPLEAGQDYDARVWPWAVDFGEANDGKFRLLYDIESQVEK
jgi:hypothetical protein